MTLNGPTTAFLSTARRTGLFASMAFSAAALSACVSHGADPTPAQAKAIGPNGAAASADGFNDEEASNAPGHLTVALKYVVYKNDKGEPTLSADAVKAQVKTMNDLYRGCNLHFRVEDFQEVTPKDVGLEYSPSRMADLNGIRGKFADPTRLVIIDTGSWDSSGGLGADGANAWTMMPGESTAGAVIEKPVAGDAPLVAHELGHYLNLDHESRKTNLMSPVIYSDSTTIEQWQCDRARESAQKDWPQALRS